MTQITTQLSQIADRISRLDFDDKTAEEKIKGLQNVLDSGDDPVRVIDEAIRRLKRTEPEKDFHDQKTLSNKDVVLRTGWTDGVIYVDTPDRTEVFAGMEGLNRLLKEVID